MTLEWPREDDLNRAYHLNHAAANELEGQTQRAKQILERLAAHLAATESGRESNLKDLVEQDHVRRAAEFVFGSATISPGLSPAASHCIFISFSHEDEAFINDLTAKLDNAGMTYFKSDRDVRLASDWAEAIWEAIRCCRMFLSVLTPRFVKSRWCDLEVGAAYASKRTVLPVLRYVDRGDLPAPFNRLQSIVVESEEQLDDLIARLQVICAG